MGEFFGFQGLLRIGALGCPHSWDPSKSGVYQAGLHSKLRDNLERLTLEINRSG